MQPVSRFNLERHDAHTNLLKKLAAVIVGSLFAISAYAASPIDTKGGSVFAGSSGVAIMGFDPVAYFIDGKPETGKDDYSYSWMGAKWKFASQDHLDKFKAEPAKYAPQYGGYCAYGAAKGHLVEADPTQWSIVDGKLYLNYNHDVQDRWQQDKPGYIKQADSNYPGLLKN